MPKLSDIYGIDDSSTCASKAASAALAASPLREWEGAPTGAASSKGASMPGAVDEKGDVRVVDEACKADSRVKSAGGGASTIKWKVKG